MRKILTLLVILLTILCGVLTFYILKYKDSNKLQEILYAVKTEYYYSKGDYLEVNLYSSSNDSFLNEYKDFETYFYDENDNIIKVNLKEVELSNPVTYIDRILYEYRLYFLIDANDINLGKCYLEFIYESIKVNILIGSLNYYSLDNATKLNDVVNLYGLSFKTPFTSIGGVYLTINNKSDSDYLIKSAKLANNISLGSIEVEENLDNTDINEYVSYEYKDNYVFNDKTISRNTSDSILLLLNYDENKLYNTFPIFININGNNYFIDMFNYIKINDLNEVLQLIEVGEFSDASDS